MIKTLFIRLLLFAAIAAPIFYYFQVSAPSDLTREGVNVFEYGVYAQYHQKIKTFIVNHPEYEKASHASFTPFNREVKELIHELKKPIGSLQEQGSSHALAVHLLRKILVDYDWKKLTEEERSSSRLIADYIRWLFLEVNLTSEVSELFYSKIVPNVIPSPDIFTYLIETQKILHSDSRFIGLKHHKGSQDHFLHGNLPFTLCLVPHYATKLIRLAHPLKNYPGYFSFWPNICLQPEFFAFIQLQPNHLYINLMKRIGVEGDATKTIEKLESQFPNLYVVTLDKNSLFYHQKGEGYSQMMKTLDFKDVFHEKMSAKGGDYFWSKHLDSVSWKNELIDIINDVHVEYFSDKWELNQIERQDFIELAYLAILDCLAEKLKPASMNITCCQGMDRAPSLAVLWMLQKGLIQKNKIAPLLLTPPILIHNRASHLSRIQRFVSAGRRLRPALLESELGG